MEPITDLVESIKFMPGRPGKLYIRLLRHREPVVVLYTVANPDAHGEVQMSLDGMFLHDHRDLLNHLVNFPDGDSLCVRFWPRQDLEGIGTRAEFYTCDPESIFDAVPGIDDPPSGEIITRDSSKNLDRIIAESRPKEK